MELGGGRVEWKKDWAQERGRRWMRLLPNPKPLPLLQRPTQVSLIPLVSRRRFDPRRLPELKTG